MKKITVILAIAGAMLAPNSKATLSLDPITVSTPYWAILSPANPSPSTIAAAVGINVADLGTMLYKITRDGMTEDGSLQSSYATTLVSGDFPIQISYTGGAVADPTYMVVKDGNLGSKVYDISSWNGLDTIEVFNVFYPYKNITGISHVEFFGGETPGGITPVPEPSTYIAAALLLIPFGMSTIRVLRKNRAE